MKKVFVAFCVIAVAVIAVSAYAEVQNVKVGGDLRFRAYWVDGKDLTDGYDSNGWVEEQVRVAVSADLTDNVSTFVRLRANDVWGGDGENFVNQEDNFAVAVEEAYVVLAEALYEPLTLKIGRQGIQYGNGTILSFEDAAIVHDAVVAKLTYDALSFDLGWSKVAETGAAQDDIDLYLGAATYTMDAGKLQFLVVDITDQSTSSEEPMYLSLYGDYKLNDEAKLFGEIIRLDGEVADADLGAWAFDLGLDYVFTSTTYKPEVKAEYLYAQGDNEADGTYYDSPLEYRTYGVVFDPELSNIQILNLYAGMNPVAKVTLGAAYYRYIQNEETLGSVGDANQDNGGIMTAATGTDSHLGDEIDLIVKYDYTTDVLTTLYAGWFFPGDAFASSNDETAFEVRGELKVLF